MFRSHSSIFFSKNPQITNQEKYGIYLVAEHLARKGKTSVDAIFEGACLVQSQAQTLIKAGKALYP